MKSKFLKTVSLALVAMMVIPTLAFANAIVVDPVAEDAIIDSGENNEVDPPNYELYGEAIDPVAEDAVVDSGEDNIIVRLSVKAETNCRVNFRSSAKVANDNLLCTIPSGVKVTVVDSDVAGGWCKIKYRMKGNLFATTGYVVKSALDF